MSKGTLNAKARIKLFCFPPAGEGASIFASWKNNICEEIDLIFVQYPGREDRKDAPLLTTMSELVTELANKIESEMDSPYVFFGDTKLDCPYAFFGHSLGALISFETARELRRRNFPTPRGLISSAFYSPMIFSLLNQVNIALPLSAQECVKFLAKYKMNQESQDTYLARLQADVEACFNYKYTPEIPFNCPITSLYATEDTWVKDPAVVRHWGVEASQIFRVREFKGNHFYWKDQQELFLKVITQELFVYLNLLDKLFLKTKSPGGVGLR